ncbi:MAG TPA: biopolymer transporter ExbD [Pirellulales bacterium]|nr:biopolymer transporter ExbD [Pirellulales bacterium]
MPKRKTFEISAEADMTPMIDMTFQLIAFFMVLLNFAEDNQDQRINLPASELAKPPEGPSESPITLQLTKDALVLYDGNEVPVAGMRPYLLREAQVLKRSKKNPADAHVIIRADSATPTGKVQELIQLCQENQFERFTLRARQEKAGR